MARIVIFLCVLASFASEMNAQSKATLSAQIYGYQQDMVYFDCVQSPMIKQEFYTNPGEEHLYTFETEDMVCMLVNGKTRLLLEPGDSLHVEIHYQGKNVESINFSGTDNAVNNNRAFLDIEMLKRDMRYKSQLLGCVALDVKPKDRINDSKTLLNRVTELLDKQKDNLSEAARNYMMADVESDVYMSLIEYPVMYASVRHLPIEQQEIGEYWKSMEGYAVRKDNASLLNPTYIGLLMRYCFFEKEKDAKEKGVAYKIPGRFEDMYAEFATFFTDDATRDAVLYQLICNFVRAGKEIERVDPILKDYREKYNKNSQYIQILDGLLQ